MTVARDEKQNIRRFLSGEEETFATVLLSGLLRMYGPELLNWDGITIQMQVKDDLNIDMPRRIYDQLMGLLSVLNTDAVYKEANVFDLAVSALNRQGLVFDNSSPAAKDVAWAVAEISLNDPNPVTRDPKLPWGKQVQRYVRAILDDEGLTIPPQILSFADSRTPTLAAGDEPQDYAETWGVAQSRADEVDQVVENRFRILLQQLESIGVTVDGSLNDQEALVPDSDI